MRRTSGDRAVMQETSLGAFLAAVLRDRGQTHRAAAEAAPPPPRPIVLPAADDEDHDHEHSVEHFSDLAFVFYQNAKGEPSYRRITIRGIVQKPGGDYRIQAYCHERDANRTFLASGIIELTDLATGEVHADPTSFLRRHILYDPAGGAPSHLRQVLRQRRPELVAFTYTARCDGRLDPREEEAICRWLAREDTRLPTVEVVAHLRRLRPSIMDFANSLGTLLSNSNDQRAASFAESVADIVLADDHVSPEERAMFDTLRERFSASGYHLRMAR